VLRLRQSVVILTLAVVGLASAPAPSSAAHATVSRAHHHRRTRKRPPQIETIPVSFRVTNSNTSRLACPTDNRSYVIRGHLIGPASRLGPKVAAKARTVTLYLHGLGYGEFFWTFSAVPGYDYATAMAKLGHASLVIDRLGYGASDHPNGNFSCLGGEADIAHQIIGDLRQGNYSVTAPATARPVAFTRVAIAGHSISGAIAEIEAYSYSDAAALLVMDYDDQGPSQLALSDTLQTGSACGSLAQLTGNGYAYFGQTPADFQAAMFAGADPAVEAAATKLRNPDPCGDYTSIALALRQDPSELGSVHIPALIVCAAKDALFPPAACMSQASLYMFDNDVTVTTLPGAGHAVTLELAAPILRARVSAWLARRGF
jgi:pimeloyl-ACP methyl ester carboxylesterase